MKALLWVLFFSGYSCVVFSQEAPLSVRHQQALEELAEKDESGIEDDSFLQQLEHFKRHPINVNKARAEDLFKLQLLTAIQVNALLQYRKLLGDLVHIYELQAIPHWDVEVIQKVLPFIVVSEKTFDRSRITKYKDGTATLLMRWGQSFAGRNEDNPSQQYLGSPQKLMIRYRYNFKDRAQFGVLAEKDAGEPLFRHKQRAGFDFYSYHLFIRRIGIVQSLAIGDFTVNMGQGLIQWQSLSFRKGSELTTSKRQAAMLRPYTSSGEINFHRGAGISLQKKRFMFIGFISFRRISANLFTDSSETMFISSFLTSGLNRTAAEQEERNNVRQMTAGSNISYELPRGHVGLNMIYYQFSHPLKKRDEPYNYFSWEGERLINLSLDYDHTWRNLHLFGEIATSGYYGLEHSAEQKMGMAGLTRYPAFIQGLLISLDRKLGAGLVFRHLPAGFQSFNGRAFTENTLPTNETGLYVGLSCKPGKIFLVDGYADVFHFPWLKFRTDAPSSGREYMIQLTYCPNRRFELVGRYRIESKESNTTGFDGLAPHQSGLDISPMNHPVMFTKINWRYHLTWQLTPEMRLRKRIELVRFNPKRPAVETGFLMYYDVNYQPAERPYAVGGRLQFFETDGFNSRIYAFENDVPSSYSIPAAYQKGWRYYLTFQLDIKPGLANPTRRLIPPLNISAKVARTIPQKQAGIEFRPVSGPDFKIQLLFFQY